MTFTISADSTESAADGDYTFPSARDLDDEERPRLLFQQPLGSEYLKWRRLDARYQTKLEEFLDERREAGEMPTDAFLDEKADNVGVTLIDEETDFDELDEDERVIGREQYRERLVILDFNPPADLYDKILNFGVDYVVGSKNLNVETADGEYPLNWNDPEDLREKFEVEPREARRQIVDGFGEYPWERAQAPIELARAICSGMSVQQKKD